MLGRSRSLAPVVGPAFQRHLGPPRSSCRCRQWHSILSWCVATRVIALHQTTCLCLCLCLHAAASLLLSVDRRAPLPLPSVTRLRAPAWLRFTCIPVTALCLTAPCRAVSCHPRCEITDDQNDGWPRVSRSGNEVGTHQALCVIADDRRPSSGADTQRTRTGHAADTHGTRKGHANDG